MGYIARANNRMNVSAILWILVIGAAIVALGSVTIRLNRASDRAYEANKTAYRILRPEFSENLDRIERTLHQLANSEIPAEGFKIESWKAPAAKTLLAQMADKDSKRLTDVYSLIEEAERYRAQLVELAAQQSAPERSAELYGQFQKTIDRLALELRICLARARQ